MMFNDQNVVNDQNSQVNQNNQVNQNVSKENERKGRGLFYGIVAVAIFIVMAVGATFAYFTATTNSSEAAVQTGSTTLQLKYISYGAGWMNRDLIPVEDEIAEYSFEYQNDTTLRDSDILNNILCKDDFGNSICSVYVFQVYNNANSPQTVSISLLSTTNSFANLWAMAYSISLPTDSTQLAAYAPDPTSHNGDFDPNFRRGDEDTEDPDYDASSYVDVTDANGNILNYGTNINQNQYNPIYVNRAGVVKTLMKVEDINNAGSRIPSMLEVADVGQRVALADEVTINGGEIGTYAIVLYIQETGDDQTADDAAQEFTGQVIVGSGDGSTGVTGTISTMNAGTVQSQQQSGGGEQGGSGGEQGGSGGNSEPGQGNS